MHFSMDHNSIPSIWLFIMPVCGKGCINGLYHSDLYVFCKSLMSPSLTLLHYPIIMMRYIYLAVEWDFICCVSVMKSVGSCRLSFSHAHWQITQSEVELLKPNYNSLPLLEQPYQCRFNLSALYATLMSNHVSFN